MSLANLKKKKRKICCMLSSTEELMEKSRRDLQINQGLKDILVGCNEVLVGSALKDAKILNNTIGDLKAAYLC